MSASQGQGATSPLPPVPTFTTPSPFPPLLTEGVDGPYVGRVDPQAQQVAPLLRVLCNQRGRFDSQYATRRQRNQPDMLYFESVFPAACTGAGSPTSSDSNESLRCKFVQLCLHRSQTCGCGTGRVRW